MHLLVAGTMALYISFGKTTSGGGNNTYNFKMVLAPNSTIQKVFNRLKIQAVQQEMGRIRVNFAIERRR